MNKMVIIFISAILCGTAFAGEVNGGDNSSGSENVCIPKNGNLFSSVKKCNRGDVIYFTDNEEPITALKVCDFTKTILYTQGMVVACVYTGKNRQTQ